MKRTSSRQWRGRRAPTCRDRRFFKKMRLACVIPGGHGASSNPCPDASLPWSQYHHSSPCFIDPSPFSSKIKMSVVMPPIQNSCHPCRSSLLPPVSQPVATVSGIAPSAAGKPPFPRFLPPLFFSS